MGEDVDKGGDKGDGWKGPVVNENLAAIAKSG